MSEQAKSMSRRAAIALTAAALVASVLLCVVPIAVAMSSWNTHLEWQENGEYQRNSFPMDRFAVQISWTAVASNCGVAIAWIVAWLVYRAND